MTKHSRLSSNQDPGNTAVMAPDQRTSLPNSHPGDIILFGYPESVFTRRMSRYLNLRSLPFSQIRVPPNMPRPLLQEKLGINHRRIPIMAIGRDVYIDTRLMLQKLEKFFPDGRLGAEDPFGQGFEAMLQEFIIDGGPYWRTAGSIPTTVPLVQNKVWMKDRFDGSGGIFTVEKLEADRSWCLSQLRLYFGILERILGDGRRWILGDKLGLCEIHAGWVIDWAVNMAQDMGDEEEGSTSDIKKCLSEAEFPRVHDWIRRFREAADEADKKNSAGGPIDEGDEAEAATLKEILASERTEANDSPFDMEDVLGLRQGQRVSVVPADFGFTHPDEGTLVGLSKDEVVIEVNVPGDQGKLRLHYPRINFKISPA